MVYQLTSKVNRSTTKLLRQVTKTSSLFTIFTNHAHTFLCTEYFIDSFSLFLLCCIQVFSGLS